MACGWITIVFLSLYQTGFLLANLTPNCTPQELNVKPEENRVVHQETVSGDHNTSTTLFMQSRHDFKGISVLVNNKDITPTWLSPQYCFLDDTEWVKIGVGVTDKQISAPYGHVTVTTDTCKWECDIATIRVPTRPVILTLLAHGSSTWQRFPSPQCYNTTDSDWGSKTDFICTPKADSKPTIRTGSVFLGLLVIMAVVVVTVGVFKTVVRRATIARAAPALQSPAHTHFRTPPYPTNNAQPLFNDVWQPVNAGQPATWGTSYGNEPSCPPLVSLGERRTTPRNTKGITSLDLDMHHLGGK